jgi:glycosyltransferase involved in cell wall biosynthesis
VALATARKQAAPIPLAARPTVDVCVTYYQKAAYLGQLVEALEQQTVHDFHVIAVNDGSPDEESNRVFEQYATRAAAHGWEFFRQENAFVDAARNAAARRGTGEYLLFIDSDDVPARNSVERLREAMVRSGDDALIPASFLFASEGPPADLATGAVLKPAFSVCIPLGIDLVGGIVNPSSFGGSMFIVKRSVFEAIHGFTEQRGAGNEDWELYVRLVLAGYKVDVVPEFLQFYRQVEGSLARTLPPRGARNRLLGAYEEVLRPLGLQGAALALEGLHRSAENAAASLASLSAQAHPPQSRYAFFSGITNKFETDANGVGGLRKWYRKRVSLEMRLKLHRMLLAPFVGEYKVNRQPPPSA